jgi:sugar phosphate isomerase/epimerase
MTVVKTAVPVNLSLADRYDRKEAPVKIGAMNHPSRNAVKEIDWIGQHGFDFVDLTLEPPAAPDHIDPGAVRAALDRHRLGVVAYTAWFLPFGSPFASVREACLGEFRRALRVGHQIGARVMNTHFSKPLQFFRPERDHPRLCPAARPEDGQMSRLPQAVRRYGHHCKSESPDRLDALRHVVLGVVDLVTIRELLPRH